MSADAITFCPKCGEQQLREFHEMGVDGSLFVVQFSASCRACDFKFFYSYEQVIQ